MCDRAADLRLAVSNLHITIMFYNPTFSKPLPLLLLARSSQRKAVLTLTEALGRSSSLEKELGQMKGFYVAPKDHLSPPPFRIKSLLSKREWRLEWDLSWAKLLCFMT